MAAISWTDEVQAIGAILTPIVVAGLAFILGRSQSRNSELLKTRLDYYRDLMPHLNDLMCYMTFIGTWRDLSPPEIIGLKRSLDRKFHCAAPVFSPAVAHAYDALMGLTFTTFGSWGQDAQIRSNAYRRRQSWCKGQWETDWDA